MEFNDVVVFLPGITGSVLEKNGEQIWGTGACAIWRAILSGGGSFHLLQLPPGESSNPDFEDGITATGLVKDLHLIPGLWKIDGYSSACDKIVSDLSLRRGENFIEFPYDWRFDNRISAKKLETVSLDALTKWRETSGNASAKLVFVAHSMGGLIARYFIEVLGGWKETLALITYGTPYRGSANALGYLSNGFSKGIGPLKTNLSSVIRSMDSVYQLLPTYKCIDFGDGKLAYTKDAKDIVGLDQPRAIAAATFHDTIAQHHDSNKNDSAYSGARYGIYPVVGTFQPTFLSAKATSGRIELLRTLNGVDGGGDGTVPRGAAIPLEQEEAAQGMFTEHIHGSLQNVGAVQQQLHGILTGLRDPDLYRAAKPTRPIVPGLMFDDVYTADQTNEFVVEPTLINAAAERKTTADDFVDDTVRIAGDAIDIVADIVDLATGRRVQRATFRRSATSTLYRGSFRLPAGAYRADVSAASSPYGVSETFLVLDAGA